MPTVKPRVQVTLEPETHAVIERLAVLQGRTRGAVIADFLDSIVPTLTRTVALIEAAAEAPNTVKQGLREMVEGVHRDLVGAAGDASSQLDMLLDRIETERLPDGVNPHVVTRGSGMGVKPPISKPKKPRKRSKPGDSANG